VFADQILPTAAENNTYCTNIENWYNSIFPTLSVFNPNHGFTMALPAVTPVNMGDANRLARYGELVTFVNTLFPIYATGYARFAAAMAGAPAAPLPPPPHRAPKTRLPDDFLGKSTAAGHQFI
jgi:hypothetical protein